MQNLELAKIFDTFADIHEIKDEDKNTKFKVRAYRQASLTLQNLARNIGEYVDLEKNEFTQEIPGFGSAIKSKILEFLSTNKILELEELKKDIPRGLLEMLEIKNVGPKKVKKFFNELNITNLDDLKKAIIENKIQELEGMGKKSADKIMESIVNFEQYSKRTPLGLIYLELKQLVADFQKCSVVLKVQIAGSARRYQETIGDIDILATGLEENHQEIIEFYKKLPQINRIENQGPTKVTAYLQSGIQIDLRVVQPDEFGAALQYFSGNQAHNVKLRTLAKQMGYKISEYGIYESETNLKVGGTEESEIYTKLNLQYVPVFLRQGNNEIDLAQENKIPDLIDLKDIKGDLHTHSTYSDGQNSIEEMALEAIRYGYKYIAITDHSPNLKVANGVSLEDLKRKKQEIETLKAKLNFPILYGTEVDILGDGTIDYDDKTLSEFDIVIASIHTNLEKDTTKRILKAMENKFVHIIGHPTTRLINKRPPAELDFKKIFQQAKSTNTILEINAQPLRLDLPDIHIREAKENYGIKFCINTDAHTKEDLKYMELGVNYSKRGWTTKSDVINTLEYSELINLLKQKTN